MLPNPSLDWPIPWAAVQLIARAENCKLSAYKCPAGVWTCGWGETDGVTPSTCWTQQYADQCFRDSLARRAKAVRSMCTVEPTPLQLGALVSLAYNIGLAAFERSTVLAMHNRGRVAEAANAFSRWVMAGGRVLAGLQRRRLAEAALYASGSV